MPCMVHYRYCIDYLCDCLYWHQFIKNFGFSFYGEILNFLFVYAQFEHFNTLFYFSMPSIFILNTYYTS